MTKRFFISFLLILLSHFFLFAQGFSPHFTNYTTSDGLPNAETFGLIQDRSGIIWFGTENGLTSFDGYNFITYSKEAGLQDLTILYIQEDKQSNIWVCTLSGRIFYLNHSNKKIYPFAFNDKILKYKSKFTSPNYFFKDTDHIIIELNGLGTLIIDKDGNEKLLKQDDPSQLFCYKIHQKIFCTSNLNQIGKSYPLDPYSKFPIPKLSQISTYQFSPNEMFFYGDKFISYVKNDKIVWTKSCKNTIKEILKEDKIGILIAYSESKDLKLYKDIDALKKDQYIQLINNIWVNSMMIDSKNGLWISTSENGIFYSQNINCHVLNKKQGLNEDNVTCIQKTEDNDIIFGLRHGGIFKIDHNNPTLITDISQIDDSPINYDLYYDNERKTLFQAHYSVSYYNDKQWRKLDDQKSGVFINAKRFHPHKQFLWLAGAVGFFKIDMISKKVIYNSLDDGINDRTFCVFQDRNEHIWISNSDGLFNLINHKLIPFHPYNSLFKTRVEDINQLQNGQLVFATKGNGIILKKEDNTFTTIDISNGLTSNFIDNLYLNNNSLWACTQQGLNHLIFKSDTLFKINTITQKNGLPTNEISQIAIQDNILWIGTSKGLVKMNKNYVSWQRNTVKIQNFKVNQDTSFDKSNLSYFQNNIQIKYLTIDYSMEGKVNYRYRLLPDNMDWTATQATELNFFSLQPNNYTFEIQSQNVDGKWSKIDRISFYINPPFWKSWWFILLLILLGMGLVAFFAKRQIKQSDTKHDIQQQISELERSALQAQMNPHFIFNCLNSIQNLILKDEKKKVIYYLGLFARLVRKNLNFSRQNKVTLEDDIGIVHSYLEMEKLRFKSAFSYEIIVDPEIQPFNIDIPPMLVQPFVENAIIHGISQKDKHGLIKVQYQIEGEYIKVTVSDNGVGITNNTKSQSPNHTSVGMKITDERLKLLDENLRDKYIIMSPIMENNVLSGTQVDIYIAYY